MTEAGYANGVDVELITTTSGAGLVEFAVGVKEMSAPAGFRIDIKTVPYDVYTARYNRKHPFNMQNWNGRPTIDEALYPVFPLEGQLQGAVQLSATRKWIKLLDDGRKEKRSGEEQDDVWPRAADSCGERTGGDSLSPAVHGGAEQAGAGLRDPSDSLGGCAPSGLSCKWLIGASSNRSRMTEDLYHRGHRVHRERLLDFLCVLGVLCG